MEDVQNRLSRLEAAVSGVGTMDGRVGALDGRATMLEASFQTLAESFRAKAGELETAIAGRTQWVRKFRT